MVETTGGAEEDSFSASEDPATLRRGLVEFLCTAFSVNELRRLTEQYEIFSVVRNEVAWSNPLQEVVDEMLAVLGRHGLIDNEFFQILGESRPKRIAEVNQLRGGFRVGGNGSVKSRRRSSAGRGCTVNIVLALSLLVAMPVAMISAGKWAMDRFNLEAKSVNSSDPGKFVPPDGDPPPDIRQAERMPPEPDRRGRFWKTETVAAVTILVALGAWVVWRVCRDRRMRNSGVKSSVDVRE